MTRSWSLLVDEEEGEPDDRVAGAAVDQQDGEDREAADRQAG